MILLLEIKRYLHTKFTKRYPGTTIFVAQRGDSPMKEAILIEKQWVNFYYVQP